MTQARKTILTALRHSLADPDKLFRRAADPESSNDVPSSVTHADGDRRALATRFGEELEAALGSFEIVEQAADVPQRIVEQIERWCGKNDDPTMNGFEVLSWAPSELTIPDLSGRLEKQGVSLFIPNDLYEKEERAHSASLSVGLTAVDAAFAGTGSMVLLPGPGRSRAASLLPLHHIALVPMSVIHPTIESWLGTHRRLGSLIKLLSSNSQLAFITGPSKSADIELNLTLGVHGPRDVHAIVFDDLSEKL